jgi:alpha-ketoglutarate-dependent taurine dioxygenase
MRFRPLHPDFGVEVIGFDTQNGGTPDEVAELRQAYDEHSMLLFRGGGRVSHARHVEIASWFGPPDRSTIPAKANSSRCFRTKSPRAACSCRFTRT